MMSHSLIIQVQPFNDIFFIINSVLGSGSEVTGSSFVCESSGGKERDDHCVRESG